MRAPLNFPVINTPRYQLCLPTPEQADLMVAFRCANVEHLSHWEPRRAPEFYTQGFWRVQLRALRQEFRQDQSVCLAIMDLAQGHILGVCNFTNIVRGTFQSCHLGYALDVRHQGQGVMHECLSAGLDYMFKDRDLHRVMANYLPANERSGRLLARLGFKVEGHAEKYLKINGRWEDHVLTSRLNPFED